MPDKIDAAAETLMEWVASLDPSWKERLTALMDERGFSARQALGSCVGYVCDQALHMSVPRREEFEGTGPMVGGKKTCPICKTEWTPRYPSQPVCSDQCAEPYYKKAWVATGGAEKSAEPVVEYETAAGETITVPRSKVVKA